MLIFLALQDTVTLSDVPDLRKDRGKSEVRDSRAYLTTETPINLVADFILSI